MYIEALAGPTNPPETCHSAQLSSKQTRLGVQSLSKLLPAGTAAPFAVTVAPARPASAGHLKLLTAQLAGQVGRYEGHERGDCGAFGRLPVTPLLFSFDLTFCTFTLQFNSRQTHDMLPTRVPARQPRSPLALCLLLCQALPAFLYTFTLAISFGSGRCGSSSWNVLLVFAFLCRLSPLALCPSSPSLSLCVALYNVLCPGQNSVL